ncbi:low affinity immunoglobulin epsilon Fc receptor, partial [Aphelenchoides avenae]
MAPFSCDEGWTLFRQSCYRLSSTWGTFTFGSVRCERSGASVHMVTISDEPENDFVNQFALREREVTGCADSGIPSACRVYVGLRRCDGCAEYIWSDGTPFGPESYENWADGEPNTPEDAGACVEMLDNGEWNDLACDNSRLSVCEKPANPVQPAPEPA